MLMETPFRTFRLAGSIMRRALPITLVLLTAVSIAPAARAEVTAEQLRDAIQDGVDYLRGRQRADGSWPEWRGKEGTITSLVALALLNAGVPPEDEQMQRALRYLRGLRLKETYGTSLQTMVFCEAEPGKDAPRIAGNVAWLEKAQVRSGPYKGAWSYAEPGSEGDNSNSQFALLALHEAEQAGVEVKDQTWRLARDYWERCQNDDGSWSYKLEGPGYGSMTCAGIASMIIASGKVHDQDAAVRGEQINCCRPRDAEDDPIERGLIWLGRHFQVDQNPGHPMWRLYYLYAVERVGRLSARRFFYGRAGQTYDWYREGAASLLRGRGALQDFWRGRAPAEDDPLIATSMALLFLSKGRRPILVAKLRHEPEGDWNRHRSDVDHLTRYVEGRWKQKLTWQTIDVRRAGVEDLLEAPVVYLCGSESPLPTDEAAQRALAAKFRDYLDRGGFLVAEAYCGGVGFDQGFRRLMNLAFPEPEYRLRLLDASHPIWHAEQKVRRPRRLEGIDFGCRTSVVYAPQDPPNAPRPSLSCLWDLHGTGRQANDYAVSVRAKIDDALALGVNMLAYATNRELRFKDPARPEEIDRPEQVQFDRGRVVVAKLRHPGGCDAAPRALINLMQTAAKQLNIRAGAAPMLLSINSEALFDHHLLFMHGRHAFRLTPSERESLKTYLERGGMLFTDSICASSAFTDSFRREMALIFPNEKLDQIPRDDPLLTTRYGGFDLATVRRRDPQRGAEGDPLRAAVREVPPDLEGIRLGDRWAVIFSPYDVSCALEKHASLECRGYTPEDAARIGLNVILYSLQQ